MMKDLIYPLVVAFTSAGLAFAASLWVRRLDRRAKDTALLRRIELYERVPKEFTEQRAKLKTLVWMETDRYLARYNRGVPEAPDRLGLAIGAVVPVVLGGSATLLLHELDASATWHVATWVSVGVLEAANLLPSFVRLLRVVQQLSWQDLVNREAQDVFNREKTRTREQLQRLRAMTQLHDADEKGLQPADPSPEQKQVRGRDGRR